MGLVFLTKYALENARDDILSDIDLQLTNVRKYLFDEERVSISMPMTEEKSCNGRMKARAGPNVVPIGRLAGDGAN